MAQLYGSCACERNQYTVIVPAALTSQAQVFFDNSSTSRRAQATPLTAWLRIPLDWYHSTTYALFPDESHTTIKRTFHTPSNVHSTLPPIRRQFCGYCGTHLTAWSEADRDAADHLDVTLGSLLGESLDQLEALRILPDSSEEGDEEVGSYEAGYAREKTHDEYADEMVKGATVDDETHISTNEPSSEVVKGGVVDDERHIATNEHDSMGGVEGPGAVTAIAPPSYQRLASRQMQNRGMPYFEEMVENSRLGRIKRQKGGHTSHDGRTTVQWEVLELDNSEPLSADIAPESKRRKTGS